jgi:hypothetical protein
MENSNDTIRNQTRDLLACSVVPQPTAPPYYMTEAIKDMIPSRLLVWAVSIATADTMRLGTSVELSVSWCCNCMFKALDHRAANDTTAV